MTIAELAIESIERREGYWSIYPVRVQGRQERFDLLKELLDNGARRTQDEWAEYTKETRTRDGFGVGSLPRYHALFAALYQHKDGSNKAVIQEIHRFLKDSFSKWPASLTRVRYTSDGQDKIIHDYGLSSQSEVLEDMVGPDEWVKNTQNKRPYKALLGTDDTAEINAIYQWLTGNNLQFWRVNKKPETDVETVARFGTGSFGAVLGCGGGPRNSSSALGVRRASAASKSDAAAQKITAPSLDRILAISQPFVPDYAREAYETELRKEFK